MQRITEPVPYTPTDPEQEARAAYMREQANLQGRGAPAYTVPIQAQPREASTGQDTRYIPPAPSRNPYGVAPNPQPVTSRQIRPSPQPAKPAEEMPLWAIIWAIALGAAVALATVPMWVPVLGNSIIGAEPKIYWYIARASGFTAFMLMWFSMASGLIISNKMARVWPGGFTAFDLHQFSSLLGMAFVVVHVAVLLGNAYVPYNLVQLLVPFAGDNYRPVWVGLGQLSLYLLIPVTFTFYIRKRLGNHLWHAIHFISYPVFALMVLHGLLSGTDSGNQWVTDIYWATTLSLVALTAYRVLERRAGTLRSV